MSIELPHRKVLILASVCISIILIAVSYKLMNRKVEVTALSSGAITAVAGETEESSMADKRVLEALDQARIDELGELASSTNPFDPSPKDSISDRFSKDVFAAFLKYQAAGGDISDEELSRDAINDIKTDSMPKPKYNLADIRIFVPKSKDDLKEYGNQFGKDYLESIAPVAKNPGKYDKRVSDLTPIYREISDKLIRIPVPDQIANEHLQLANSFAIMADTFEIIDNQQKDPVKALLGLRIIQDTMPIQIDMFTKISDYFKQNGIIFNADETGAMWTKEQSTYTGTSSASSLPLNISDN